MGSKGSGTAAIESTRGPRRPGPLHDPLDRQVALVGAADVADLAQALLLRRRLEDEVAEAQQPPDAAAWPR